MHRVPQTIRYLQNPFVAKASADVPASFKQTLQQAIVSALQVRNRPFRATLPTLLFSLSAPRGGTIVQQFHYFLIAVFGSVYVGCGGLAYMMFHLSHHVRSGNLSIPRSLVLALHEATSRTPDTTAAECEDLLESALRLCNHAQHLTQRHASQRCTFLEGHAGPLALKCAILSELGRSAEARMVALELFDYARHLAANLPLGEDEVLYGRAGLLYALMFAEHTCKQAAAPTQLVESLVRSCIEDGMTVAKAMANKVYRAGLKVPPLMCQWHAKAYMGAAHGLAGILHVLSLAKNNIANMDTGQDVQHVVDLAVADLASLAKSCPEGNLPPSFGSDRQELVQWCHGAPGLLILLANKHERAGIKCPEDIHEHMLRLAELVWERGLLRKGVGLCHGIAGNGYSLLSASRALGGDHEMYNRACLFGLYSAQEYEKLMHTPDRPSSLFEGLAGAVCFWSDLLGPELSHFPGFEMPPTST